MATKKNKPNIVFIWSDQQRQDTMECYGNDWIKTPRLNELASDSYVIDNAYCTQPVCAPARSSVIAIAFYSVLSLLVTPYKNYIWFIFFIPHRS